MTQHSGTREEWPGRVQKAADVWKKDVWDFQAFSQTCLELRFSLGMKGKTAKTSTPRLGLELPDILLPDICDHPKGALEVSRVMEGVLARMLHRGLEDRPMDVTKKAGFLITRVVASFLPQPCTHG